MAEFKSFQRFLILMLPFTAMTHHRPSITFKVGDEATLSCEDAKDFHDQCHSTTWIFTGLRTKGAVPLFEYGQIHREAAAKSDRLSVTEKCSLVIKKVTDEDHGHYTCRQFDESERMVTDSDIDLSVINREDTTTATTTTTTTLKHATSKSTTATTKATTKLTKATTRPTIGTATAAAAANTTSEQNATNPGFLGFQSVLISGAVVLAALLIIVVVIIRWKRGKGNNGRLDDNTADPPDGVSYASIRYKEKTNSKAQGEAHRDDPVIYSTLNISSISAGVSTDPSNFYASINKTNI